MRIDYASNLLNINNSHNSFAKLVKNNSIELLLLALISLALYYLSLIIIISNIWNLISFLYLSTISFYILSKLTNGWIFLLLITGLIGTSFSVFIIELTNPFLIEAQEYAQIQGSSARISFLSSFFLLSSYLLYEGFSKVIIAANSIKSIDKWIHFIFLVLSLFMPIYFYYSILIYSSPLILEIDRFYYMTHIVPEEYKYIYGQVHFAGFIVALAEKRKMLHRHVSIAWLISIIIALVIAGEKFSRLVLILAFYFIPYFSGKKVNITPKFIFIGIGIGIIFAVIILSNYYFIYGSTSIFWDRIALQGQLNYLLDMRATIEIKETSIIIKKFLGINESLDNRGMVYFMYLVAPIEVVKQRLDVGATFTTPFPGNFMYFFGTIFSPLFIIIQSFLIAIFAFFISLSTKFNNFIISLLSVKGFFLIYVSTIMGEQQFLTENIPVYFISIIILLIISISLRKYK